MEKQLNAKELLLELMKQRNWHGIAGDKPAQRAAGEDKRLLTQGRLSYEKCVEWLEKLGWKKIQEETWSN